MDPHGRAAYWISLAFTFLGAGIFAFARSSRGHIPQEAFIGIAYAVASATAILLMSKATGETEHLKDMLVGNILSVSWPEVRKTALLYGAIGVFHFVFRKRFLAKNKMKDGDGSVEQSRLANFGPGNREDVADEHVLEVLGFAGGFAHEQDGGSGSNGVSNADKSFLGNVASAGASEREDSGAKKREREADPIRGASVRVHAGDDGDGGAECCDLRKGQVHKNDATLDHMHAQIGVNPGENDARDEGCE